MWDNACPPQSARDVGPRSKVRDGDVGDDPGCKNDLFLPEAPADHCGPKPSQYPKSWREAPGAKRLARSAPLFRLERRPAARAKREEKFGPILFLPQVMPPG